jgi:hypothetical protein
MFVIHYIVMEKIIVGKKYGNLKIIKQLENDVRHHRMVLVKNTDGFYRSIRFSCLVMGETKGIKGRHFLTSHPLFWIWRSMKDRCDNLKNKSYKRYGGRGIKYATEWSNFMNFYNDNIVSYKKGLTLDRVNNDGNYSKENCRWVNQKVQSNNRNNTIKYNGETLTECCERLQCGRWVVDHRIRKGWDLEKAFFTPVLRYKTRNKTF